MKFLFILLLFLVSSIVAVMTIAENASSSTACSQTSSFPYSGSGTASSPNSVMMTLYTQAITQCTTTLQTSLAAATAQCAQFCLGQSSKQVLCLPKPTPGRIECSVPSNMNAVCHFSTNPQSPGISCGITDSDILKCACTTHNNGS